MRLACLLYPLVLFMIVFLVAFSLIRIAVNEQNKSNPPAACQVFGGQWTIWEGWKCD